MNRINKEWHEKNKMPKNPTIEEQVAWHKGHLKHCSCRTDVPDTLKKYFS